MHGGSRTGTQNDSRLLSCTAHDVDDAPDDVFWHRRGVELTLGRNCSKGFCVAMTMNGEGSQCVRPETVT